MVSLIAPNSHGINLDLWPPCGRFDQEASNPLPAVVASIFLLVNCSRIRQNSGNEQSRILANPGKGSSDLCRGPV